MSFFKKKDKKGKEEGKGVQRSSSVVINKPRTKNKQVSEYYALLDELCQLFVQNGNGFACHLISLDLGLTSIPRLMNCFSIFRMLVREEFHEYNGDTSLLLRNTSRATKWMKGIVEAESRDMVLLEKRVLWLLNKSSDVKKDAPASPIQTNTTPKKSSFLAPSVAVHQQIIQKEETPEGAGSDWCEEEDLKTINEFDPELRHLCNCLLGIMHCCAQAPALCRLATATSDEVKRQKREEGAFGDDDFSSENLSHSGIVHSGSPLGSLSDSMDLPCTNSSPASSSSSDKDKKKEKKKKKTNTSKRAMRRKVSDEERNLFCWTVTNIILLHFAVPVIASRSVKCKPEKKVVKFSKLVARSIMKVAANSEMNKGTEFERFNPVLAILHRAYLNFCQDVVESGLGYSNYAPEIKRGSLSHLKTDLDQLEKDKKDAEFAAERASAQELCEQALRKAVTAKKSRLNSSDLQDSEGDLDSVNEETWRAPTMMDASQLDVDDFTEPSLYSSSTHGNSGSGKDAPDCDDDDE